MLDPFESRQAAKLRTAPSVSQSIRLSACREDVFSILAQPNHLELFHPFCKSNSVSSWDLECRRDQIEYLNGLVLERNFLEWIPNEGFELLIGRSPTRRSLVRWSVIDKGPSGSEISISVHPFIYLHWSWMKTRFLHRFWIRGRLQSYLGSVLAGLDYYLRSGKPTPRNFQGTHPWFSR